jgi:hypothetical protein
VPVAVGVECGEELGGAVAFNLVGLEQQGGEGRARLRQRPRQVPRAHVAVGLAAAPEAFLGLLKGRNFGKQLVKLV